MTSTIADAEQALQAGRQEQALEILQELLATRQMVVRAHLLSAIALRQLDRLAEAKQHIDAVATMARQAPNPVAPAMTVANEYLAIAETDLAEAMLRDALTRAPDALELKVKLADILTNTERAGEAVGLYRFATTQIPENASVWASLGVALQKNGETTESVRCYENSLARQRGQTGFYNNLLAGLLELGRPQDAIKHSADWVALEPANVEALAFHALLLVENGQQSEAAPLLDFDRLVQTRMVDVPEGFDDLVAFNQALASHVLQHEALKTPPEDHPTWHHPALKIGSYINSGACGPVEQLEQAMHKAVSSYFEQAGEDASHPFLGVRPNGYRIEAWSAVLEGEGNQKPHIHKDGYLSGCYYITIPEEISSPENGADGTVKGGFEVGRPPEELEMSGQFPSRVIKPAEGLMVLFPAYLYHGTIPFKSDQKRICIAFDVVPEERAA